MSVLSPAEVRTWLSIKDTGNDDLIRDVIAQAEAYVAARCGPLEPTATTSRVRGGPSLVLPALPVVSVTSVTGVDSGSAVTVTASQVDGAAGVVYSTSGFAESFYTVVYQAGRASCPADLKRAAVEMCRYLWRSQQGPVGGSQGSPSEMAAFNQAETLIAPYRMPGFA